MPGTYLTPSTIANEALMLLSDRLVGTALFRRNHQEAFNGAPKIGTSISVRRCGVGTVTTVGATTQPSLTYGHLTETSVQVPIEKHSIIPVAIDDSDLTLKIDDFSKQVLEPQINQLAQTVNTYTLTKLQEIPTVGGPSSSAPAALISSVADLALVDQTLNDQQVPIDSRLHIVSSALNANLLSITGLQKVNEAGNSDVLRRASVGEVMGLTHAMSQAVPTSTHTSGTMTSAVVNGALDAGATSIVFDGASGAAHTLKKYDILTISNYGNVTVAADVTASSSAGTVTIFDPLREAVANDETITVYDGGGNTRQLHGAAFHPDAFEFVSVPGAMPRGGAEGFVVQDGNLSMRVIFSWNATGMINQMSLDLYYGAALVDPRLACQTVKNI